jgi:hypothetical protein
MSALCVKFITANFSRYVAILKNVRDRIVSCPTHGPEQRALASLVVLLQNAGDDLDLDESNLLMAKR